MEQLLTLQLLSTAIGGVVGGLRTAVKTADRPALLRVTDFIAGLSVAVAVSGHVPTAYPLVGLIYGMAAGSMTGYALDITYKLLPQIIRALLKIGLDNMNKP